MRDYANPSVICRALTKEEIHNIIPKMGGIAMKAASCGVDLINIHAHNGYLID